ncbi:MAG: inorganic phosphate transporter [Sutterella seckii]
MMEIARSGVFNPQMFSFAEIMVIFFAVMVADVILLDAFNTLGLPTSTTVSIVFELLGSAIAAALLQARRRRGVPHRSRRLHQQLQCLAIISGILISVVVAFVSGAVIQYIARLIFSFRFEDALTARVGGVYAGLAFTAIIYFLVMKGAKGASFMRPEWIDWINANTTVILVNPLHRAHDFLPGVHQPLQHQRLQNHHPRGHVLARLRVCRERPRELRGRSARRLRCLPRRSGWPRARLTASAFMMGGPRSPPRPRRPSFSSRAS